MELYKKNINGQERNEDPYELKTNQYHKNGVKVKKKGREI